MNRIDWKEQLDGMVRKALSESWDSNQERMIHAFHEDELVRIDCFMDSHDVGHAEELIDIAQRYQGNWCYENNVSMSPVF